MRNLTKRQFEFLVAVDGYIKQTGYSPSFREIGQLVNVSSSSTVQRYMESLKDKGYITWLPGQPRTLKILKNGKTVS